VKFHAMSPSGRRTTRMSVASLLKDSAFIEKLYHSGNCINKKSVEYLMELYYRAVLEAEKSHPANFHNDESGYRH
jgi:hypothetical protein